MKLFLHIGTEKTGTTSVQQWLHLNETRLTEDGVWYARCLGRPSNRWIAVYARAADEPDDGFAEAGINGLDAHTAFCKRIAAELMVEVQRARSQGCRIFFISSEHLHSRLTNDTCKWRLHGLLEPLFDEIEVLCYVRPQAEVLQSRLSLGVRGFTFGLHEFETIYSEPMYYDYYALWKRWASVFKQVTFLPWKRRRDVVRDICDHIGIDVRRYAEAVRTNEKLDYRTALLVFNILNSKAAERAPHLVREIFLDDLPVDQPLRLPRHLAKAANDCYRASNKELTGECPQIGMGDLEADLNDFPVHGNAHDAVQLWDAGDHLGFVIMRLNAEIALERACTQIAMAERALADRQPNDARIFLTEASNHLASLGNLGLLSLTERSAALHEAIAILGVRSASMENAASDESVPPQ